MSYNHWHLGAVQHCVSAVKRVLLIAFPGRYWWMMMLNCQTIPSIHYYYLSKFTFIKCHVSNPVSTSTLWKSDFWSGYRVLQLVLSHASSRHAATGDARTLPTPPPVSTQPSASDHLSIMSRSTHFRRLGPCFEEARSASLRSWSTARLSSLTKALMDPKSWSK